MKAVMPVRRALGVRTVFNVLGPLTNPAGARAQVMGVYSAHLVPIVAEAMRQLGVRHAFVVHGSPGTNDDHPHGMDELSISGPSQHRRGPRQLRHVPPPHARAGRPQARPHRAPCAEATPQPTPRSFAPSSPAKPGPRRDVVLLNAAAVLITAGARPQLAARPPSQPFAPASPSPPAPSTPGAVTALVAALSQTTKQYADQTALHGTSATRRAYNLQQSTTEESARMSALSLSRRRSPASTSIPPWSPLRSSFPATRSSATSASCAASWCARATSSPPSAPACRPSSAATSPSTPSSARRPARMPSS